MKALLTTLICAHGLIHVFGFAKAFGFNGMKTLVLPISKAYGILWFIAFLLFSTVTFSYFFDYTQWWIYAFVAVVFSQLLVFKFWEDAQYTSIPNAIILAAALVDCLEWNLESTFRDYEFLAVFMVI